jgi:putative flippase GtrA
LADSQPANAIAKRNRSSFGKLISKLYHNSALRYLAVGGTSFLVDFSLLYVFHELFGIRLWISTGIAFLASFFFNFTFQKIFAFSSKAHRGWSLVKYILLVGFNTIATIGIVALLYTYIGWEFAKVVSTVLTTVWNYLAYRYVVFSDKPLFRKKGRIPNV